MRKKLVGRSAGPRRKQEPQASWPDGPSPWWPAWSGSTRVLWGPRLGRHPSPNEIIQPLVPPRRRDTRGVPMAARAAVDEAKLEALEVCVVEVLKITHPRRTSLDELDSQRSEIARLLLEWKDDWDRWRGDKEPVASPGWLLQEPALVKAIVAEREQRERRKISGHDGRLRVALKEQRKKVGKAEEALRRAKARPHGSLIALCKAHFRLYRARVERGVLAQEVNRRRSTRAEPRGKRPLPKEYVLAPLLWELFRRGLPDQSIASLLPCADLPPLSPRQIKRIRAQV